MPGTQSQLAGWTGGAGGRQMENQMENCLSGAWTQDLSEPTTQPLHHIATLHTRTHTHTQVSFNQLKLNSMSTAQ